METKVLKQPVQTEKAEVNHMNRNLGCLQEYDDLSNVVLWLALLRLGIFHGHIVSVERTSDDDIVATKTQVK